MVTGRLGTVAQKKVDASYSITTISEKDLRERAIGNLAEAMQQIPGVWADSSGGVGANNTRVRGIPRGGYESLAVYEDGLPIQHDPGINWINVDQFLRIDETYSGIEAVRGGPSSIFAANAPGGLVNFIPRKGTPQLSGLLKLTTSDYGQIRGDAWLGGPIADGWRFSVGGYYNKDQGIRDPGPAANNGGQGRVLISKDFARGSISFGVKYMEDNNFFFDAIPLVRNGDDLKPLAPFNGHDDTLTGPQDGRVQIKTPDGIRKAQFNLFNQTSDLQFTLKGNTEFDDGTTVSGGFRYRDSTTDRNARGLNSLNTQAAQLSSVRANAVKAFAGRGATDVRLVYNDDGSAYGANANGNGLVGVNTFQSIQNPIKETMGLFELGHVYETGIGRHDVKLGLYGTTADWAHDRNDGVGLTEVAPNARLLDIVAVNAGGQVVGRVTDTGIQRYEARFAHSYGGYEDVAFYISDEWQITPKLRVDGGFSLRDDLDPWLFGRREELQSGQSGYAGRRQRAVRLGRVQPLRPEVQRPQLHDRCQLAVHARSRHLRPLHQHLPVAADRPVPRQRAADGHPQPVDRTGRGGREVPEALGQPVRHAVLQFVQGRAVHQHVYRPGDAPDRPGDQLWRRQHDWGRAGGEPEAGALVRRLGDRDVPGSEVQELYLQHHRRWGARHHLVRRQSAVEHA
ncbi:TonB-dependent receptor plug domain-containing protein [Sphingomonas sp. H160509]|uniref:TonB-dependent receptor plug domain-containing protein n=1 Tax=Sphingomonas sp. H160509 TaxID=2955313 RepID=UPI002096EF29|nr:TonB-dependent receptor plug domain-containing protein [Sphingomonas sp. H160509]MDD1452074.1 TonB-dependent receptor plug domain-containing protein [Sphingomonas sp. H160509]